jgi:hypothetical protein
MSPFTDAVDPTKMPIFDALFQQLRGLSGAEKRRALHRRELDETAFEVLGHWIDKRPQAGDSITVYRKAGKHMMEIWFSDGCHSLNEMTATHTSEGLKLEDLDGNLFGEYLLLPPDNRLQFCNSQGCFYEAEPA